jgi:YspA, cpYpsA-related SLOG family
MFILMVSGPRKFNSKKLIWETLDRAIVEIDRGLPSLLIHGDAEGTDTHADSWAKFRHVPTDPMPPEYEKFKGFRHGSAARAQHRYGQPHRDLRRHLGRAFDRYDGRDQKSPENRENRARLQNGRQSPRGAARFVRARAIDQGMRATAKGAP